MNLPPEAKIVGKENFAGAIASEHLPHDNDDAGGKISRREFLMGSITAGLVSGGGLGAYYFGYGKSVGDPVRVGVIGTGDEGGVLIGALNPEYLNVVAIADIRPYNLFRAFHGDQSTANAYIARPGLMNKYGWKSEDEAKKKVTVYDKDYHELLKDDRVEAVIIALPLHLHARVAVEAMRAGKHVLTEKLMGHSVAECKEMARVAEAEKKLLATGHQRHYSILYDNAVQVIKNGLLGDLHHIRAQWHRGNLPGRDSWQPKLPRQIHGDIKSAQGKLNDAIKKGDMSRKDIYEKRLRMLAEQVKDEVLGQTDPATGKSIAESYGYQAKGGYTGQDGKPFERSALEELIRWRLWERTGGGLMAELGSHQLDAASIFISAMRSDGKKVQPLRVIASGGRHIFPHDRDCEDHVYCTFEFPAPGYNPNDPLAKENKIVVTYSSINGNGFGGYGEVVMGTDGTMILEKEQEVMLFGDAALSTKVRVSKKKDDVVLDTTQSPGADAQVGEKGLSTGPISRGYTEEMEHWAWCVRQHDPDDAQTPQPRCKPEVALGDAVIALTSNLAIRNSQPIDFDPKWFDIDSDKTPEGQAPDLAKYDG